MKTFSFINKKGGVGKTTITVNMAYAIAESCDLRVLVIDNDDQGNDSQFFDAEPEKSLADILLGKANIQDVIQSTRYSNIPRFFHDPKYSNFRASLSFNELNQGNFAIDCSSVVQYFYLSLCFSFRKLSWHKNRFNNLNLYTR